MTNTLRDQLLRALDPSGAPLENPLEVIGLSTGILNLGLSDDDLYDHCRKVARSLVVRFHPDRAGTDPVVTEQQRRYAKAFEELDDRGRFDSCLQNFKQNRSFERTEVTSMKR